MNMSGTHHPSPHSGWSWKNPLVGNIYNCIIEISCLTGLRHSVYWVTRHWILSPSAAPPRVIHIKTVFSCLDLLVPPVGYYRPQYTVLFLWDLGTLCSIRANLKIHLYTNLFDSNFIHTSIWKHFIFYGNLMYFFLTIIHSQYLQLGHFSNRYDAFFSMLSTYLIYLDTWLELQSPTSSNT